MDKRGILAICAFVIVLACFFQFSRMDGFLHLGAPANDTQLPSSPPQGEPVEETKDTYLVLYDPHDVSSVFARHRIEWLLAQQKKGFADAPITDATLKMSSHYQGVLVLSGYLDMIASWQALQSYVEEGGTAVFFMRPEKALDGPWPTERLTALGLASVGGDANVKGISLETDFLFGGKGFSFGEGTAYNTNASQVSLMPEAKVHVRSYDGMPLVWEHKFGQGRCYMYNGIVRDDKTNIGLLSALINHCGDSAIYPVLGTKLFFIDDFPSPVPEGYYEKIYDELGVSTEDFYRNIWWPFMRGCAKDFGLLYTGLIIESYGDQVKGPFGPAAGRKARDSLIVYGRELLDMGGELGLHGYNHQSLAPDNYVPGELEYVPWASQADMIEGLQELRRYIKEAYPGYTFKCYVPPSDILSPEGREAILQVFPEVKIFSSLFDGPYASRAYIQDYERHDDGVHEIPRTSAGFSPSRQQMYENISVINYIGNFSHFVHPDELFYEESKDLSWGTMEDHFRKFLAEINERFGWLRPVTDSECAGYFDDYLDMDYRVRREQDHLHLTCWSFRHPLRFVLRTEKEIERVEGGSAVPIGDDAYMIETKSTETDIYWKEGS